MNFLFLSKQKNLLFILVAFNFSIYAQDAIERNDLFQNYDSTIFNQNSLLNTLRLDKKNANNVLEILPLGNSITFDTRASDTRPNNVKIGYRLPLLNLLNNYGLNFDYIGSEHSGSNFLPSGYDDNAGFPGITDLQLANLLKTGKRIQPPDFNYQITSGAYLETYLPDMILLHIGTNGNNEPGGTSAAEVKIILDEIDRVEELYNKKINVAIARIIDRVPNETYVHELNDNVDSMVTDRILNSNNPAYPDNIMMVDMEDSAKIIYAIDSMGTVGNGIIGDMSDDRHPNDKGFVKMSEIWFKAIEHFYPRPIIARQPSSKGTLMGSTLTLSIEVNSEDSVLYQWKRNGVIIPGAVDSFYTTSALTLTNDNDKYFCEINSGYYSLISDTATIFVSDTLSRITNGLIAYYNFEEGMGDLISNQIVKYSDLDLKINNLQAVNWIPYGLKINNDPHIFTIKPAKDIYKNVQKNNEISLEAWIVPDNDTLTGPARIITYSKSTSLRNMTLAQEADSFEVRLRSSKTDNNGKPSTFSTPNAVKDSLTHLVYTRNNLGEVSLYINGELNKSDTVAGDFSNWDSTFVFGLANEFSGNRLWSGKFYLVGVYDRALSFEEQKLNFKLKFNGYNRLLEIPTNLSGILQNETDVDLSWVDNSSEEIGFIIERKLNKPDSLFRIIDTVGINVESYIDTTKKFDSSYVYRIRAFNNIYFSDYSDEAVVKDIPVSVETNKIVADKFYLYQNYPNPFNPITNFKYSLAKESNIELKVFNSLGEVVRILQNKGIKSAGVYLDVFNGSGLASGVYFYQLIAKPLDGSPSFVQINKLVLLK